MGEKIIPNCTTQHYERTYDEQYSSLLHKSFKYLRRDQKKEVFQDSIDPHDILGNNSDIKIAAKPVFYKDRLDPSS